MSLPLAIAVLGSHIRTGFENHIHFPDGTIAPSTTALVDTVTAVTGQLGHRPATLAEAREIYGMG